MKKAVRRHQQRVAKYRRVRILLAHRAWKGSYRWEPKIWHSMGRLCMNEPGWWVHERVVVPARTDTRRLERAVVRGVNPEVLLWPDCKKPHDYYW